MLPCFFLHLSHPLLLPHAHSSVLYVCISTESESLSVMSDSLQPHELYTVHGILQARILEWVAFPFSRGSFKPRDRTQVSHNEGGFFTN